MMALLKRRSVESCILTVLVVVGILPTITNIYYFDILINVGLSYCTNRFQKRKKNVTFSYLDYAKLVSLFVKLFFIVLFHSLGPTSV